jgi:hypothetical protein
VAYSAGWWSEPDARLAAVPALIVCGEDDDERFGPTREFFERGHALGLPFVWRSFRGVGHELTDSVRDVAEAFLAAHCGSGPRGEVLFGDLQTHRVVGESEKETIPPEVRIELPSAQFAKVWSQEP